MDIRRRRILFGLAELIIVLASVFLLLDAMLGFTGRAGVRPAQMQPVSSYADSTVLSASCAGGFSNESTAGGITRVAPRGTPFNAYQITLTNTGISTITIYSMNVDLVSSQNKVFAQHHTDLGGGSGITLAPGQSRQIVEAYGINRPVASCQISSWQS